MGRIIHYADIETTGLNVHEYAKNWPIKLGLTGGHFNPIHRGHIDLFKESKKQCNFLIVAVNNDYQSREKSGYSFMSFKDRAAIVSEIRYVDLVVENPFGDMTDLLRRIRPYVYLKGGDRSKVNMLQCELEACEEIGSFVVYNTGGHKVESSSLLLEKYARWHIEANNYHDH